MFLRCVNWVRVLLLGMAFVAGPVHAADTIWVEDAIPTGATSGGNETWTWISANPAPYSGSLAHQSANRRGLHQHLFQNVPVAGRLSVSNGDSLYAYVYLDPASPPSEIMLQWHDGTWEHRAYWGANLILKGTDGTNSRRYMGALPAAGQWVRLEVPASQVGLEGKTLRGMSYLLYNGRATWDQAGKASASAPVPTVSLSANPSSVATGGSSTLTWSATDATSCTASGAWSGSKATSGNQSTGVLTATSTYTLTCSGAGGSASQSVTVTVNVVVGDPIDNLKPGEWYAIPNSKMRAVDPCPANNCPYSGVEGTGSVIWSWSGGAYDSKRDRLLVWGGGHTAYAGNEIYAFDMNSLSWTRVTDPSSITGYVEGSATYPDGRPVSVHSYDQIEYDPVMDRMFVFGGSRYQSGSNTDTAFTFNFDSKQWTQVSKIPGDPYSEIIGLSLNSAYDPVTGLVYIGGAWSIATYSVAADQWKMLNKNYGGWELWNGLSAALDHKRRKFVQIGRGYAFIWDISVAAPARENLLTTGAKDIEQCDAPGLDYDPVSDRIVAWCANADVYTLNLDTKEWTKVAATNSVTPGDPHYVDPVYGLQYHGTFGRFRYVPSKNVFVVVTDIDKDVYVYKLSSAPGTTPTPTVTLSANPGSVTSNGSSTLTWSSTNATTCTATGDWSGSKSVAGSEIISAITAARTFFLSCTGAGGTALTSVVVTVTGALPPTATLSANPGVVNAGAASTLSWSSTNATSCIASGAWSGNKAISGTEVTAVLNLSSTFTLACTGSGGTTTQSTTVTVATQGVTDVTSLTLSNPSSVTQTQPVITFGHVFRMGDVPAGSTLSAKLADESAVALQVDKKAIHADGSMRHAILTAQLPSLSGNASALVKLGTQPESGAPTAVSLGDLLASNFDAQASLTVGGVLYTASARSLLQTSTPITWLSGPQASEWIVGAPVKTAAGLPHPHLTAYFHVRAYAGTPINRVRVDMVIENNWTMVAGPSDFTYDVALSVGGSTVYSKSALTHFTHARWHKAFWWGSDPGLTIAHDKAYLQNSGAVSKYMDVTPPESVLSGMRNSINPMEIGDNRSYMASTGENSMIGPQPEWVSLYLVSMDPRAYTASLRNADGGGTYNSHYRNELTGYPATTSEFSMMQINEPQYSGWLPPVLSTSPHEWDSDHQPALAYVPYLVTGDYYYLEELQFWAEANMFLLSSGTRQSMIGLQVRGQAWSLRTLGQAAYITPDTHPLKLHLNDKVKLYLANFDEQYTNSASANKLGVIWSLDDLYSPDKLSHGYFTVWMDDYLTWAAGYMVELGFNEAIPFRNWKAKFPADRMGGSSYCWQVATPSQLKMGEGLVWYPDIATVYLNNFPTTLTSLTCGTQAYADWIRVNWNEPGFLINEMTPYGNEADGHPSKTQIAMAIAVDAGATNASIGWNRLITRADPPDYAKNPKYAVVPRVTVSVKP